MALRVSPIEHWGHVKWNSDEEALLTVSDGLNWIFNKETSRRQTKTSNLWSLSTGKE